MLPFLATVDLGAMPMKEYSAFPKLQQHENLTIILSVYSTAPADRAIHQVKIKTVLFQIIQFRCQNSSISSNLV